MKTDKEEDKRRANGGIDKTGDKRRTFVSQTSSFSLTGVIGRE
jgi:hypothetical protein